MSSNSQGICEIKIQPLVYLPGNPPRRCDLLPSTLCAPRGDGTEGQNLRCGPPFPLWFMQVSVYALYYAFTYAYAYMYVTNYSCVHANNIACYISRQASKHVSMFAC